MEERKQSLPERCQLTKVSHELCDTRTQSHNAASPAIMLRVDDTAYQEAGDPYGRMQGTGPNAGSAELQKFHSGRTASSTPPVTDQLRSADLACWPVASDRDAALQLLESVSGLPTLLWRIFSYARCGGRLYKSFLCGL